MFYDLKHLRVTNIQKKVINKGANIEDERYLQPSGRLSSCLQCAPEKVWKNTDFRRTPLYYHYVMASLRLHYIYAVTWQSICSLPSFAYVWDLNVLGQTNCNTDNLSKYKTQMRTDSIYVYKIKNDKHFHSPCVWSSSF